eukprot:scaffold733_cov394-Pavlova_lutheri.AAC.4
MATSESLAPFCWYPPFLMELGCLAQGTYAQTEPSFTSIVSWYVDQTSGLDWRLTPNRAHPIEKDEDSSTHPAFTSLDSIRFSSASQSWICPFKQADAPREVGSGFGSILWMSLQGRVLTRSRPSRSPWFPILHPRGSISRSPTFVSRFPTPLLPRVPPVVPSVRNRAGVGLEDSIFPFPRGRVSHSRHSTARSQVAPSSWPTPKVEPRWKPSHWCSSAAWPRSYGCSRCVGHGRRVERNGRDDAAQRETKHQRNLARVAIDPRENASNDREDARSRTRRHVDRRRRSRRSLPGGTSTHPG